MSYSKDSDGVIVKNDSGVIDSINPLAVEPYTIKYKCIVDKFSSTVTYVGTAVPGSLTSSSVWQIIRISKSGTITNIEFADSNEEFDNIWDDRGSLIYG